MKTSFLLAILGTSQAIKTSQISTSPEEVDFDPTEPHVMAQSSAQFNLNREPYWLYEKGEASYVMRY